ncbi:MAG: hypothetical protein BEN19_06035 [Epulopiscium sp. Nuni2H_MBin003]|nr:MAG: hypothetical protein BEN19_06035 [Epulopiscium sp. Nuni2H_MBin003]
MYEFKGTLPRYYSGNVCYQYNLQKPCKSLRIRMEYMPTDREENAKEFTEIVTQQLYKAYNRMPSEDEINTALKGVKTEIQLAVYLNDEFLGNIHNPSTVKDMLFDESSERTIGCIKAKPPFFGKLKIIVNSFYVIDKEVSYTVQVETEEA